MPDQCGPVALLQINTPMPSPTTDPTVPRSVSRPLEEPEQRIRVTRIFADAAADPKIAAFELAVSLGQRARLVADADVENELPAAEAACLDVMNSIGQVCNGGYEHWVDNGYYLRGEETCAALETLGLVRFARLTENALNAIPLGAAEPSHLKTDGGAPLSSAVACLRLHDVRWQSAALV